MFFVVAIVILRLTICGFVDYYYRALEGIKTNQEKQDLRQKLIIGKYVISLLLALIWLVSYKPKPAAMSTPMDLWIRIEFLFLIIEPLYFDIYLRWLNSHLIETGFELSYFGKSLTKNDPKVEVEQPLLRLNDKTEDEQKKENREQREKDIDKMKNKAKGHEVELEEDFYTMTVLCFLKKNIEEFKLHSSLISNNLITSAHLLAIQNIMMSAMAYQILVEKASYFNFEPGYVLYFIKCPCVIALHLKLYPEALGGIKIMKLANNSPNLFR